MQTRRRWIRPVRRAAQDQFDTIDFTGNDIRKVGGFPRLERLKTLLLSRNRVM